MPNFLASSTARITLRELVRGGDADQQIATMPKRCDLASKDFIKRIVIAYACQSRGVCGQGHGGQWSAVDTEAACQFGSKMLELFAAGSTVSAKQQLAPALSAWLACFAAVIIAARSGDPNWDNSP